MRAIARRLGVSRKAVRRVLVEASANWEPERAATARGPDQPSWTLDRA
nr:hypothetical protein [Nesterenkonia muleiensis]